jgi:hypothetical protein
LICFLAVAAAALCCSVTGETFASEATVTIEGVHYTLPTYFKDAELKPRTPLCRQYEYFQIVIVGRALFINGALAFEARAGDKVVVAYPGGAFVNGRPALARSHRVLDEKIIMSCTYSD